MTTGPNVGSVVSRTIGGNPVSERFSSRQRQAAPGRAAPPGPSHVSALLPGYREAAPILRLRYQGSADRWAIGIYLASDQLYTEAELPTSFGPKTGTPEQGIDHTFILYAGPGLQP